jgi:hypothetical protein
VHNCTEFEISETDLGMSYRGSGCISLPLPVANRLTAPNVTPHVLSELCKSEHLIS